MNKKEALKYAHDKIAFEIRHTGPSCMIDKECNTNCEVCGTQRLLDIKYPSGRPVIAILDEEGVPIHDKEES